MPKKEQIPISLDLRQHNPSYGTTYENSSAGASRGAGNNNNPEPQTPTTVYTLVGGGKRRVEVRDHCHRQRSEGVDIRARKKLIIASALCLLFMICEVVGGVLSNSLAIATDAAHLLTDFASFMISLFAIWIAGRPSTQRMSFGWYRAEVIGALASVVMIWFITAILVWLAIERIINRDFEVDAKIMLITSGLAILVNLIMGLQLHHGHTHGGGGGHSHGGGKPKKSIGTIDASAPRPQQYINQSFEDVETGKATKPISLIANTDANAPAAAASATGGAAGVDNNADDGSVDATLPSAGLRTFSYQNTRSISEVHAEIAAVMAETAPGAHHHGGEAGKEAVNLNVRAAFIHVIGDMVQSVGVFLAALLIYFRPDWAIADPICTFIFSVIVLLTTFSIMKDALLVLMEGTPSYMHYTEVLNIFQQIEGVQRVHNLRIWALSINKIALSVHLAIGPGANPKKILQEATSAVHLRYNFFETTIQIEDFTPDMEGCQQCTVPEK